MYSSQNKHNSLPYYLLLLSFCLQSLLSAQNTKAPIDSTLITTDSIANTLKTDSITSSEAPKKKKIETPINYNANDSIVLDMSGNAFMYGEGKVKYGEIDLSADYIHLNTDSSSVNAKGSINEDGEAVGLPILIDNGEEYNATGLRYNFDTKKGYIVHGVVQQGEGYIIGDKTKKVDDEFLCMKNGKYTTCDDHDHPHFYLNLTKAKVKQKKWVVTGPAYLVMLDVPLPLAIPFGYFPFTKDYSSGVIIPSYGDDISRGFYLSNGGYYFALSDYMDLTLTGDIYTMGTWATRGTSNYTKRYRYRGNVNFSYRVDVIGDEELDTYQKNKNFALNWTHSQDAKANPNRTFSASVNFSSSGYDRSNINGYYNAAAISQNIKSSSVSYGYRFPETPFSMSANLQAQQRTADSTISLTTPDLSITMSRIYPFKRKDAIGKDKWYEKFYMSYSGRISNSIETKEDSLADASLVKDWRNGFDHSIPMGMSFNILKYLSITPNVNYHERWYLKSIDKSWDYYNEAVVRDTSYNFTRDYEFSAGVSASTKVYGFFTPNRKLFGDQIERIRHVFTPTISYSFKPDFSDPMWHMWKSSMLPINERTNHTLVETYYNPNERGLFGSSSRGKSSSINISVNNNLEMKWKQKNDTTGESIYKTVSLIDALSGSASYNYAADSLNWSTINGGVRLKLFKGFNLSLNATFETYLYENDSTGTGGHLINTPRWEVGKAPRLINTSTSFGYTFNNATFKKKEEKEAEEKVDKKKKNISDDGYQAFKMPWSLSFDYSLRYGNKTYNQEIKEYDRELSHNMGLRGTLSLTSKWNFNFGTAYDFDNKEITYSTLGIQRNLHCWSMSANIVPYGPYKTYNILINVTSSLLSDLKYEKQKDYTTPINWY